jgi:hypothetical protein
MSTIVLLAEILLGFYLAGSALMFFAHLFFLMAFWGELRHSGHAGWSTAWDIFVGSLWSGVSWPWVLYRGYWNLRQPG